MEAYRETAIEHEAGAEYCGISTGERAVKTRLYKLRDKRPESVEIIAENADGSVFAHIPWSWISIRPPKSINYTEEQKKALVENLGKYANCGN